MFDKTALCTEWSSALPKMTKVRLRSGSMTSRLDDESTCIDSIQIVGIWLD